MISTVLLDLDNTLISNPDRQFAIAFISKLNEHFQKMLNIEDAAKHFRKGIQLVGRHQDESYTNSARMLRILAEETSAESERIQETLDLFYQKIYPQLKHLITPQPVAIQIIDELLAQKLQIIIATQPIYPELAVTKRLEWGNLSKYITDFALITHSENMYSAKPSTSYYEEILSQFDLDINSTLMVGDSIKNDIQPAQTLGLKTFYITPQSSLFDCYKLISTPSWHTEL